MGVASVMNDNVLHDSPHCHAPIHPAAPVPTPVPHPPIPLSIINGAPTVMIGGKQATIVTSMSKPCMLPSCVPAGPGIVMKGSMTVMITCLPAGRLQDMVAFAACVAPIPSPTGKIVGPGVPTVMIGG